MAAALAVAALSCRPAEGPPVDAAGAEPVPFSDAENVRVWAAGPDRIVEIRGAFDDATTPFTFRLTPARGRRSAETVAAPVRKIVCLSSTHLGFLRELGSLEVVAGVSLPQHAADAEIRERIAAGAVAALGEGAQLDVERLIELDPDAVLAFGVAEADLDPFGPVRRAGIPVVLCADYTERTPLGRAEWIRFFGMLVGKEEEADRRFAEIRSSYRALAERARQASPKPTVLVNASFQGVWYLPGGESYMARFLEDAGARYLWSDDRSARVLRLDFESALVQGAEADYWLHPGVWSSLADGLANDERYRLFRAFREGRVYNHNKLGDVVQGNDFYERGAVRADLVLADLVWIFHPDLVEGHAPVWYHRLPER